ncbi:MAG: hypothetical protein DWQ02_15610 [Bacteroidetes bacterium]|nr:MAG: hypothetical protein DWQ02_15610 [Bacteroidota bacterium]
MISKNLLITVVFCQLIPLLGITQHCIFENHSLCVITFSSGHNPHDHKLQIALADFYGNRITNNIQYNGGTTFFSGQKDPDGFFFYNKRHGRKMKFSRPIFEKYPLSGQDYLMLIPNYQLEEIFKKHQKVYLQIQTKKGENLRQTQMVLKKKDFHPACTGAAYWNDKSKLQQMKILIQ